MNQPVVESIDIYGIGPDGEKVSWSSFLGPMYEAMIVVELTFDNGLVGIAGSTVYTEHEFDRSVVESASLMAPFLLGKGLFDIPKIYAECMSRYVPLKNVATSLFDIAMHDAKGKLLNLPIYKMLGQAQPKVRHMLPARCWKIISNTLSTVTRCWHKVLMPLKSIRAVSFRKTTHW
ncbi:mandelate racemase/muconate lactonizing enzyme family protein [Aliamphritea spongicola]|nr:mandelate racemase/muconate lactonizing enzyme family protein [Aliamphritea spongicola]